MRRYNKLKWERAKKDSFDLHLLNPKDVNVRQLRKLLRNVEISSANWRKNMRFNQRASRAFRQWLDNLSLPLPAYAYALLSNWFKTRLKFIREGPRGIAARVMWDALFCTRPERRLTKPKRNYKILREEFNLWWPKQLRCQDDC